MKAQIEIRMKDHITEIYNIQADTLSQIREIAKSVIEKISSDQDIFLIFESIPYYIRDSNVERF